MKNPLRLLPAMGLLLLLAACNKPSDPVVPPAPAPETSAAPAAGAPAPAAQAELVGGGQDAHGCKGSAGYSWSQVREKCLRIFEDGILLNPVGGNAEGSLVAYLLFDQAQARAEIFLPGGKGSLVLLRQGEEGSHSWEAGALKLLPWKGYVLQQDGQAIYAGE